MIVCYTDVEQIKYDISYDKFRSQDKMTKQKNYYKHPITERLLMLSAKIYQIYYTCKLAKLDL